MVRVRYAPSPTGTLHIGGARTALFNYLFAKHHHGRFILRVEDTDRARLVPGSEEAMMKGLRSLGIVWDEGPDVGGDYGPYRQSERVKRHQQALEQLLAQGLAYRCYCTPEELEAEKKRLATLKLPPRYSGKCRLRPPDDPIYQSDKPFVVRMKVPTEGETVVHDLIRGTVVFENRILDDFVLAKSDGTPVYNFAVVLDDHDMGITHVIRGEEHLSNTPKQILIYQALNLPTPQFAHVPMILAPDRSKLSKRHGATSVEEYRQQGILPEALVNYLLLLGWSAPDETEIMTLDQAAKWFDLDRVQHTAAIYDYKKLEWMNSQYLRLLPIDQVIEYLMPFLEDLHLDLSKGPALPVAVELVRERAHTLKELAESLVFLYQRPTSFDPKGMAKHFHVESTPARLRTLAERLQELTVWDHDHLVALYDEEAARENIKRAELIHPTRLAVTGKTVGPGLFELLEVLGQKETVARLKEVATAIEEERLIPTP
ncbi:glutamyl-tRNA synthetase [Sulfobacillus thermosulfidooxidans DSM 9293]|uniref:Glutamate--tRNA ligase n=1 Tax=Sulfobacillus thermosulfidooxidans (strain DSM 9293 / VKM B-1269 / AT-1) TaxID=929705 RepID=A0A1W1WAS4_SULTA|nr:glutamate--tRNA ligase [Sulfobacillus thermosulfidooxidans]SMC03418.1 glutamyl-tRNA synthetase [Sulfobacillus thermosulfidooxidans DSM 9293]